jgi:DNA-binding XRE family transcriptional regulator
MSKVTFLKTEAGEIVIMPRDEYDRLVRQTDDEDAGTRRIVDRAKRALAAGSEVIIPKEIADRIAGDESVLRVIREWRGMTQAELAEAIDKSQSYVADLEAGRRDGPAKLLARIARTLRVPLDLLVPAD